ncbi:N-acetylmuramoyl-L-alanine amidase family protein [Paenibacillus pasadenensis]|uniref:N-acetylmuramoyl-L-alanine amidase n=1 Tax=Paenibacillus pasadenensis TaxID=217090 RepID=A0A2N5N528_9BACL|nr:N-acetylmuramoyl-L-alanine amidase [Paenibacillus pasadenensis]PLT45448.1 N-acetylmuramoyl-L-alanine amidase [Paenibacillus pasadenensis]
MKQKKLPRCRAAALTVALALLAPMSAYAAPTLDLAPPLEEAGGPSYKGALPYAEVLIDAGHGGIDGGTFYEKVLEKDTNLAVAKKLLVRLQQLGVSAVLNRVDDYALSDDNRWLGSRSRHQKDLSQRTGLTEEIHTGMLVSLHVNWSKRGAARGPVVLHQKNRGESVLLALCVQDALNRQQLTAELPRAGSPFYLLNTVKQPAVIVEMGFISNGDDRAMLTSMEGQQKIAEAIASGVRQYKLLFR